MRGTKDSRYHVDERVGIIAVIDTAHSEFKDVPGCHSDYPWVVAAWHGTFDGDPRRWSLDVWQIDKANDLASNLNRIHRVERDAVSALGTLQAEVHLLRKRHGDPRR